MAVFTKVQAAHTYGVLDPHLIERRDTKFVDGSLSDAANIVVLPQGGYTDRGGTDDFGRVRRQLTAVAWTAGMATLPNGGTAGSLLNRETQTTSAASGSRFVLAEIDFGAAQSIAFIDIGKVKAASAGADAGLVAEYWTGSAWATFGAPLAMTTAARSRRFGGAMTAVTAQKFRVCADATAGVSGAINFSHLDFFAESASLSAAQMERYRYKAEETLLLIVSDRNIDVFQAGVWRAAIALPAPEAIIAEVKFEFGFDTILAFHQDMEPQRLTRLGAVGEWSCEPIAFENVPLVDYGATYANGVNEVQEIEFYSIGTGDKFQLVVEGKTTAAINIDATGSVTAAAIAAAMEALPNVDAGVTVVADSASKFTITFTGGDNAGRDWLEMTGIALDGNGYVRVRTITDGKTPGEPVMSAARGWPAVGRLAQKRLILAGFKSKPNSVLASVTGSPFDLNTELELATAAFLYDIGENEANVIRDVFLARTLIFFGSQQHAWLKNATLSAESVPDFGFSDAPGIDARIRPVSSDNAIFYMQDGGTTLRMLSYTEIEQNFVGDNASILSAHLIKTPRAMTRRRARGAVDSDLLIMPNADGTATALTLMRTQEVSGFAPWATDGAFRFVLTDHDNEVWFLAERTAAGAPALRLEKMQPDKLLDEAEERTLASPVESLTGLSRFNGRAVWVVTADEAFGPYPVLGGAVTFALPIEGNVRVGTWTPPFATDPPVNTEQETARRQAKVLRCFGARLSLLATTSAALAANDGPAHNLSLVANDALTLDEGPLARPFSGTVTAEGMHGFTEHGKLTVTQVFPGKLTVRRVAKDIVS